MNTQSIVQSLTVALLLIAASVAVADDYPATRTFEAQMNSVRMPVSPNGTVTLRECDSCAFESVRVTPRTRYHVNGKTLKFSDFLAVLKDLRASGIDTLNVTRDEASQTAAVVFVYADE